LCQQNHHNQLSLRRIPWKVENEERDEIRSLMRNLDSEAFIRVVGQRYGMPPDDPWVLSMLKLRDGVGLDAVITALRKRDTRR
jgi:hypothetical protein